MKKIIFALGSIALMSSVPTFAKPDHAAQPNSGNGCWVRASDTTPYRYDPTCEVHSVLKRNKDGTVQFFHYQDKSALLPGQIAPDRAVRYDLEMNLFGLPCTGNEVITPSGQYSSNLKCS